MMFSWNSIFLSGCPSEDGAFRSLHNKWKNSRIWSDLHENVRNVTIMVKHNKTKTSQDGAPLKALKLLLFQLCSHKLLQNSQISWAQKGCFMAENNKKTKVKSSGVFRGLVQLRGSFLVPLTLGPLLSLNLVLVLLNLIEVEV